MAGEQKVAHSECGATTHCQGSVKQQYLQFLLVHTGVTLNWIIRKSGSGFIHFYMTYISLSSYLLDSSNYRSNWTTSISVVRSTLIICMTNDKCQFTKTYQCRPHVSRRGYYSVYPEHSTISVSYVKMVDYIRLVQENTRCSTGTAILIAIQFCLIGYLTYIALTPCEPCDPCSFIDNADDV